MNRLNIIRNKHNKTLNDELESAKRSFISDLEWRASQAREKEENDKLLKDKAKFIAQLGEKHSRMALTFLQYNNNLDEVGIWNIHGEDPNCDFGGSHTNPFLETVEGTYRNACLYAVKLLGFYQWGAGGYVRRTSNKTIKKV